MQWLIEATARLPLSDQESHAHFAQAVIDSLGPSAAHENANLSALFGPAGAQLEEVLVTTPTALAATVRSRGGREPILTMAVDRAGLIAVPTVVIALSPSKRFALPTPSGAFPIGSDVLKLTDRSRGGRRVIVTRWYPATPSARTRPLVEYASPRLRLCSAGRRSAFGLRGCRAQAAGSARAGSGVGAAPAEHDAAGPGGRPDPDCVDRALARRLHLGRADAGRIHGSARASRSGRLDLRRNREARRLPAVHAPR